MADQGTFRPTAWGRAVVAVMMTLFATAATTGAAGASPAADRNGSPGFAAQASSLGLTSAQADGLQRTADGYLAKTDGTQVAINKIVTRAGGELLIPLPGEKYARDLADKNGARTAAAGTCPYTYVCAFALPDFEGARLSFYDCNTLNSIPWSGNGSWKNNQASHLRAKFYDINANLGWTSPGGYSQDNNAPWGWVYYLSPC